MESEGLLAFCPRCQAEYTFFGEPPAPGRARQQLRRASDDRLARVCFACSLRPSRWDVLLIPVLMLVVALFPLLWMIWSNLIGPIAFLAPAALALRRRIQRCLGKASPSEPDRSKLEVAK